MQPLFVELPHGRARTNKPYWVNVGGGNVVGLQQDSRQDDVTHVFLKGYENTCPVHSPEGPGALARLLEARAAEAAGEAAHAARHAAGAAL
jgi:hypothetical protein